MQIFLFPTKDAIKIQIWLSICAVLLFILVIIGGATRLTNSGLSMVEWQPLNFLPPLNPTDWMKEFSNYQNYPEFKKLNSWMNLEDFKKIFWLEYIHRLWGRIIGLVFGLPFIWLLFKRKIKGQIIINLFAILILGGAQGILGWYMVSSGLIDNPDVSQYRLASHLALAFLIQALIVWTLFGINVEKKDFPNNKQITKPKISIILLSILCLAVVFSEIISGAFVAGLDAGLTYNTFPLMDKSIIPDNLYALEPWYINWFENILTVQFNHRALAFFTLIIVIITCTFIIRSNITNFLTLFSYLFLATCIMQVILGITTLLLIVPIWAALIHQALALILLTINIIIIRLLYNENIQNKGR